ncbi:hypothetical protein JTB14_031331 [Gonioctena quinquepunctata]|nr:hypothetical protein JTB14_031331 [Gonioctena quinquepunctata]
MLFVVQKRRTECSRSRVGETTERGIVNTLIFKLPSELHLPGYQYFGPDNLLRDRLAKVDSGINPWDRAFEKHDITYDQNPENIVAKHEVDGEFEQSAWERVK